MHPWAVIPVAFRAAVFRDVPRSGYGRHVGCFVVAGVREAFRRPAISPLPHGFLDIAHKIERLSQGDSFGSFPDKQGTKAGTKSGVRPFLSFLSIGACRKVVGKTGSRPAGSRNLTDGVVRNLEDRHRFRSFFGSGNFHMDAAAVGAGKQGKKGRSVIGRGQGGRKNEDHGEKDRTG